MVRSSSSAGITGLCLMAFRWHSAEASCVTGSQRHQAMSLAQDQEILPEVLETQPSDRN